MKKAVTFRFNAGLLEDARRCAVQENRSLTNFIETLVKNHVTTQIDDAAHPTNVRAADQPVSRAS